MGDEMLLGRTIVVCDTNWQLIYKQKATKATDTNNEILIQQHRGMEARLVNELRAFEFRMDVSRARRTALLEGHEQVLQQFQ